MKNAILTAAMILGAGAATADSMMLDRANMLRASDLMDNDVYTANNRDGYKWDMEMNFTAIDPEWDRVGEIEDLVFDNTGKLTGVIAEVGGLLDIGDKHVFLPLEAFRMFDPDINDMNNDMVFVTGLSVEEMKAGPDLDKGFWE